MIYTGTKDGISYGFFTDKTGVKNCIEISDKEHMDLLDGQSKGKTITFHKDKKPTLETPKTLEEKYAEGEITKSELNAQPISEIETYLKETDWYIVRFAETGVEIPLEVKEKRVSARLEISELRGD